MRLACSPLCINLGRAFASSTDGTLTESAIVSGIDRVLMELTIRTLTTRRR